MNTIKKPVLLDETGKEIVTHMRTQNALLAAIARESIDALTSWKEIQTIVKQGLAPETFHIGDQFIVPWKDVVANKTYDVPLDIVHFDNVELQDGEIVPAMFLQWHYAIPFDIQFDAPEQEVANGVFSTDYSYYVAKDNGYKLLTAGTDYVIGEAIPTSPTHYRSAIKDTTGDVCKDGYNRWSHSAVRQFLNSKAGKGAWWVAQHLGDVPPDQLATNAGFMTGFDDDFLSVVGPIKVTTALSGIGSPEATYDTFFLPSLEQMYAKPLFDGVEGDYFEYWKRATNRTSPNEWYLTGANPGYITYDIETKTTPRDMYLRTAGTRSGSMCTVDYRGAIYSFVARANQYCAPVCAVY